MTIGADNRDIITTEWIIEGVALIFLGLVVAVVTAVDPRSTAATVVFLSSAACLVVLAVVSLFCGFRIHFLPFRFCPAIFTTSAVLIVLGMKAL